MKAPMIDMSSRRRIALGESLTSVNSETFGTNWQVADSSLRPLPAFHPPLERHCIAFVGDASPSLVAARISECLKKRSIVAEYDDEGATARATTWDRVRFEIVLHSGGAKDPLGVIVEITRIRGCPRSFHRTCRAVLNASRGDTDGTEYPDPASPPLAPLSDDEEEASTDPAPESAAVLGIEIAWSLLKKDRLDANSLGMESVVCLTDAGVSGSATALVAAEVVLLGALSGGEEEPDPRFVDLHRFVLSLVGDGKTAGGAFLDDDSEGEDDSDAEFGSSQEDHHISSMRYMALKALSNALEIATTLRPPFWKRALQQLLPLIPSLVQEIARPAWNAHDAAVAARILRFAVKNSVEAQDCAEECGAWEVLEKARDLGRMTHAQLEREAGEAMTCLRGGSFGRRGR